MAKIPSQRPRFRVGKAFTKIVGAWRSLVSAPVWGTGGRWFKSSRPDQLQPGGFRTSAIRYARSDAVAFSARSRRRLTSSQLMFWKKASMYLPAAAP